MHLIIDKIYAPNGALDAFQKRARKVALSPEQLLIKSRASRGDRSYTAHSGAWLTGRVLASVTSACFPACHIPVSEGWDLETPHPVGSHSGDPKSRHHITGKGAKGKGLLVPSTHLLACALPTPLST